MIASGPRLTFSRVPCSEETVRPAAVVIRIIIRAGFERTRPPARPAPVPRSTPPRRSRPKTSSATPAADTPRGTPFACQPAHQQVQRHRSETSPQNWIRTRVTASREGDDQVDGCRKRIIRRKFARRMESAPGSRRPSDGWERDGLFQFLIHLESPFAEIAAGRGHRRCRSFSWHVRPAGSALPRGASLRSTGSYHPSFPHAAATCESTRNGNPRPAAVKLVVTNWLGSILAPDPPPAPIPAR